MIDKLLDSPKTTIGGIMAAGLTVALIMKVIDISQFGIALGSVATFVGLFAKDADR
jgi:hypothetical protein